MCIFFSVLRFSKSFEVLYGALHTIHLHDPVLRLLTTFSRIHQSLFLLFDHFIWLSRAGLIKINDTKYSEYSNKFWLYSIIMNLMRDFYEIIAFLRVQLKYGIQSISSSLPKKYPIIESIYRNLTISRPLFLFIEMHPDIFWDTVKNVCDIWLPLTALGYSKLSPGFIGLLGTLSTIAGIVPLINPLAKLSPI